jgi:hypothetical protein
MTPDEVVKGLDFPKKKEHNPNNTTTEKHIIIGYNHCVDDFQPLIQDYQKLRERVSVEKIDKIIDEIMPCSCISAYKDRGLTAPDCANHNYKEDLSEQIVTYLQQPTEH